MTHHASARDADNFYMQMALNEAHNSASLGEVPVGAVVVQEIDPATGKKLTKPLVISKSGNNRESAHNPTGHAELLAIHEASQKLGRWRLSGCTLYVTLEPCVMCAGAIVLARLDRVVYGSVDPKAGAVQSLYEILSDERLNHRPHVVSGVLDAECSQVLKNFFAQRREKKT